MVEIGAPIFVLAIHPRSGTNFLTDLLCAHPLVDRSPIPEDFLAERAGLLATYAEQLIERWEPFFQRGRIGRDDYTPDRLLAHFGQSLLQFAGGRNSKRHMVFKTPALLDLANLQRLFPSGQMIVLLRDPRSIAESWMHAGFDELASLEKVGYQWANTVRALERELDPQNGGVDRDRLHFVRFEQLARDPADEYAKLSNLIGLVPDADAFTYAADPPVIGSSFENTKDTRRGRGLRPTFTPKRRPQDFDPTCRWAHWSTNTHRRFNRICGTVMRRWGYLPVNEQVSVPPP